MSESPYVNHDVRLVLCLVPVVLCGILSTFLIPIENYNEPNALTAAAIMLAVGLLSGTVVAILRNPAAAVRCEHILMFGIFYWLVLDLLLEIPVRNVSREALVGCFSAIWSFAASIWLGTLLVASRPMTSAQSVNLATEALGPRFLFFAALCCALFALMRYLVACKFSISCIIDTFDRPRFDVPWGKPGAYGMLDTLFWMGSYAGMLVLPLTAALVATEKRLTWRGCVVLLLGLIILVVQFRDGGRKDLGTVFGGTALVWMLVRREFNIRMFFKLACGALGLILAMQFMLVAREKGVVTAFEESISLTTSSRPLAVVDRNIRYLAYSMDLVPDRYPYSGMSGVIYATTFWIPYDFRLKREGSRINIPYIVGLNYGSGYTWASSAIGDLYLIGGFPAIIVGGILFGFLAGRVSAWLGRTDINRMPILYALSAITLFLSLRTLHEFFLTGMMIVIFVTLLSARQATLPTDPRYR